MPVVAERACPLVYRDHTQAFARIRRDKRRKQQRDRQQANGTEALIGEDGGPATPTSSRGGEGPSLPPEWVDFSDKAREDIDEIRSQLTQLTNAHERRLHCSEGSENALKLDKDIQGLASSISTLTRCCEQSIHQVRSYRVGAGGAVMDEEFRQNVQRNLAAQLQQLSKQVREAQKEFLRRRQQSIQQVDAARQDLERGAGPGQGESSPEALRSITQAQAQETVQTTMSPENEEAAAVRSGEIAQLASSISELHQIFKDLSALVIEQGTVLDRIDYNTEKIYKKSDDAKGQMRKAVKRKRTGDSRVMKCFIFWVSADVVMLVMLLVKYQLRYGLQNVLWVLCVIALLVGACVLYSKRRNPQLLNSEHWLKACPDLDPKAIWRKIRPGPVNAAKAAAASARMGGALRGSGGI